MRSIPIRFPETTETLACVIRFVEKANFPLIFRQKSFDQERNETESFERNGPESSSRCRSLVVSRTRRRFLEISKKGSRGRQSESSCKLNGLSRNEAVRMVPSIISDRYPEEKSYRLVEKKKNGLTGTPWPWSKHREEKNARGWRTKLCLIYELGWVAKVERVFFVEARIRQKDGPRILSLLSLFFLSSTGEIYGT